MCHRLPLRTYQLPLFAFLVVIRCVVHYSRADVELATVVLPRLEDEMALLVVERKPGDVDRTVWYRLFIHRPPDARSIVIKSHVLRLRGSVPGCLLSSTNTKYIKIEWLLIFVSCNTFHGTILQHFNTRRCVDIRLMQPSSLTNHQWSIKKAHLVIPDLCQLPLEFIDGTGRDVRRRHFRISWISICTTTVTAELSTVHGPICVPGKGPRALRTLFLLLLSDFRKFPKVLSIRNRR